MSAQTLNIIYDTNYTSVINGGGFVENNFSSAEGKKWGLFGSLFWSSTPSNQQNTTPTQASNQQQGDKAPWFFDLLFWPLNSNTQTNNTASNTKPQDANSSKKPEEWKATEWNIEDVTQNHEIAQDTQATKETEDTESKPKKKSWIDSMLDSVFGTDEWSNKNKKSSKWKNDDKKSDENDPEEQKKLS